MTDHPAQTQDEADKDNWQSVGNVIHDLAVKRFKSQIVDAALAGTITPQAASEMLAAFGLVGA